jgi:hypothetical protein
LHAAPSPQAASFGRGGGVTGSAGRAEVPPSLYPLRRREKKKKISSDEK